jgi:hypothetical protein
VTYSRSWKICNKSFNKITKAMCNELDHLPSAAVHFDNFMPSVSSARIGDDTYFAEIYRALDHTDEIAQFLTYLLCTVRIPDGWTPASPNAPDSASTSTLHPQKPHVTM